MMSFQSRGTTVLDDKGAIDQHKIDLVSRMGGNWYSRANQGMFEVEKPLATLGIGVDQIPEAAKNSGVFSGNDLGVLGNVEELPTKEEVALFVSSENEIQELLRLGDEVKKFEKAKKYLEENNVTLAWKTILAK